MFIHCQSHSKTLFIHFKVHFQTTMKIPENFQDRATLALLQLGKGLLVCLFVWDKNLDNAGLTFRRIKLETIEQAENRLEKAELGETEPKRIDNLKEILDKVDSLGNPERNLKSTNYLLLTFPFEKRRQTRPKKRWMISRKLTRNKVFQTQILVGWFDFFRWENSPSEDRGDLFKNLYFLLNRETPQDNLELIIRACGGSTSRLQFCTDATDSKITHQVPNLQFCVFSGQCFFQNHQATLRSQTAKPCAQTSKFSIFSFLDFHFPMSVQYSTVTNCSQCLQLQLEKPKMVQNVRKTCVGKLIYSPFQ